ncbi:hypothetical protein [Nocardiopsis tropica]|uniref:Secreted protein n=2 Tax=Nocardiopsis tropica TaxID=109330 RepID=A0ABU7KJR7_9ACTN|nr:hypothetical protein [Nocardiopsis umidischolae]MEE2049539.1 hypothetical protein [Nocardiopsis umidischolae]
MASAVAAAVLTGTLLAPAPASAAAPDCDTHTHANAPDLGIAACGDPIGQGQTFRAAVTCGRAPDVKGARATVGRGGHEVSQGRCARFSSGVGAIGVDERPV